MTKPKTDQSTRGRKINDITGYQVFIKGGHPRGGMWGIVVGTEFVSTLGREMYKVQFDNEESGLYEDNALIVRAKLNTK